MKGNYSKRFEHDKKQKNVHNHYTNHLKNYFSELFSYIYADM